MMRFVIEHFSEPSADTTQYAPSMLCRIKPTGGSVYLPCYFYVRVLVRVMPTGCFTEHSPPGRVIKRLEPPPSVEVAISTEAYQVDGYQQG
jgi:hypothetical protein